MAKICYNCERSTKTGNSRSKSNIATKRKMSVNLQKRNINGKQQTICTSCLKTIKKNA